MKTRTRRWLQGTVAGAALLAAFALGFLLRGGSPAPGGHETATQAAPQATLWTCSMHPQIQLPKPGQCPICGMDLIPLETQGMDESGPRSLSLSPTAAALAEIRTTAVERRAVETRLRMVGILEPDEGRVREISAWVPGRIERLFIDATGFPVQKGEPLFEIYSPELFSAQEELLQAIKAANDLSRSSLESSRRSAGRTVEAARERLRLWGLTAEQIRDIESRGTPSERIVILAPMSGIVLHKAAVEGSYVQTGTHVYAIADLSVLWLQLDVYEADLAWIALGQKVEFSTEALPGVRFEGRVSFIDPVLDQRSRSVNVRVDVDNRDGHLKPGMFARAVVRAATPLQDGQPPLVIPRSAPLITGERAVVYVAEAPGRYHGREVLLGPQAGDFVVVREGLEEGESVVSHGAFKIDSALQIQAKTSMMNPPSTPERLAKVPADFQDRIDVVLAAYFKLSTALSHDDLDAAREAARQLATAVSGADAGMLGREARTAWEELRQELAPGIDRVARADDIAPARAAFHEVSQRAIRLVRLFGTGGDTSVHLMHCPMARDGAGADWLQPFEDVENPYYGSAMFRCGERTETLVRAAGAAEAHEHEE